MKVKDIIVSVINILASHDVESVYLFGSRAKNLHCERSDIDLAFVGNINRESIEEKMDSILTLKKIDLVDVNNCSEILKQEILANGIQVYNSSTGISKSVNRFN
jgi:predicted nucleotidyltransferase